MKRLSKLFSLGLIIAFSLVLTTCDDWEFLNSPSFNSNIRGTWVSNQYEYKDAGKLEIKFDTIRITGYGPKDGVTNAERPFRNYTQNVPLEGYSEGEFNRQGGDGFIFIYDRGSLQSRIPVKLYSIGQTSFLLFTFGDREELLRKTGD